MSLHPHSVVVDANLRVEGGCARCWGSCTAYSSMSVVSLERFVPRTPLAQRVPRCLCWRWGRPRKDEEEPRTAHVD